MLNSRLDRLRQLLLQRRGANLVKAHITQSLAASSDELFSQCWNIILDNEHFFEPGTRSDSTFKDRNAYKLYWTLIIFPRFLKYFKRLKPDFIASVRHTGEMLCESNGGGRILLTFHTGLEMAICRCISDLGFTPALVTVLKKRSRRPLGKRNVAAFGVWDTLELINKDKFCLLSAIKSAKNGRSVVLHVDYSFYDVGSGSRNTCVNGSLLEFLCELDLPVFWAIPRIDSSGAVEVRTYRFDKTKCSGSECFKSLISIVDPQSVNFSAYSIGNWSKETSGHPSIHQRSAIERILTFVKRCFGFGRRLVLSRAKELIVLF